MCLGGSFDLSIGPYGLSQVPSTLDSVPPLAFGMFEALSVAVFTFELLGRTAAAPLCSVAREGVMDALDLSCLFVEQFVWCVGKASVRRAQARICVRACSGSHLRKGVLRLASA